MIMKELYAQLGISSAVYDFGKTVEDSLKERFEKFDKTAEYNQMKVLKAMQEAESVIFTLQRLPDMAIMIWAVMFWRRCMPSLSW